MLWKINIDFTHFYQLTSVLWIVPDSVQNQNQFFCTTAIKVILPSTTYEESAVYNVALYVFITNCCSWKIVLRNLVGRKEERNIHMPCIM